MLWMLDCYHSLAKMVNLLKSHQEVSMVDFFILSKLGYFQGKTFETKLKHTKAKHKERRNSC